MVFQYDAPDHYGYLCQSCEYFPQIVVNRMNIFTIILAASHVTVSKTLFKTLYSKLPPDWFRRINDISTSSQHPADIAFTILTKIRI